LKIVDKDHLIFVVEAGLLDFACEERVVRIPEVLIHDLLVAADDVSAAVDHWMVLKMLRETLTSFSFFVYLNET